MPIERGSIDLAKETCFLSLDWGIGAPSACGLIWPNPPKTRNGTLYMIDELYTCDRTMDNQRNWTKGIDLNDLSQAAAIKE